MARLRAKRYGTASPRTADDFLKIARRVVGEREASHGEIVDGQSKIAIMWNAYLEIRRSRGTFGDRLNAEDVTAMMQLLKIVRMHSGGDDVDDDVDNIGYGAKLAEVRAALRTRKKRAR